MVKIQGKKIFCLVTGASQGIGQCIAVEFSKLFSCGSKLLLLARSKEGLQDTKDKIIASASEGVNVQIFPCDLATSRVNHFNDLLSESSKEDYEACVLIHNAGSEGDLSLTKDMTSVEVWQSYMALNLYSVTVLTSVFLTTFSNVKHKSIINITSLAAIQPIKGLGYYCVGKAAREMYFGTLAEENPDLDILNYSPGPVDTEMVTRTISKLSDSDTKKIFADLKANQKLVKPIDTVSKLIRVFEESAYKSGGRLDYFNR